MGRMYLHDRRRIENPFKAEKTENPPTHRDRALRGRLLTASSLHCRLEVTTCLLVPTQIDSSLHLYCEALSSATLLAGRTAHQAF